MKGRSIIYFISCIVVFQVLGFASAEAVEPYGTEICRLFADGAELRSPGSCQDRVTCQGGISTVTSCPSSQFYNKDTKQCVDTLTDQYCTDPCVEESPTWVADPKSCDGYFRCRNGVGTAGTCGTNHFEEATQSCVYPEDSTCKGYAYCDVVPNDTPFKDESTCDLYFMCVQGTLTEFQCESGYYHPQLGCTKKSNVACTEHPIPEGLCGTIKKPIRNKFVNDQRTCRGYYYCSDKGDNTPDPDPVWGQCPNGYFFDSGPQYCFTASDVYCEDDRCDGRNRARVISGTQGCQHYLHCNGDVTVAEEQCPDGMYFDDASMACTASVRSYASCV